MEITATNLKKFFKGMGLPVRGNSSKHYVRVWIDYEVIDKKIVYSHEFPLEFRVKCLNVIYPGMQGNERGSAGNVSAHGIAMGREEWKKVLES